MPRARRSRRGGRASPPRMRRGSARRECPRRAAGRTAPSRAPAADWSFLLLQVAQVAVVEATVGAALVIGVLGREHAIGFGVVRIGPCAVGVDLGVAVEHLCVESRDRAFAGAIAAGGLALQRLAGAVDLGLLGVDLAPRL